MDTREIPEKLKKRQIQIAWYLLQIKKSRLNAEGIICIGEYEVMPYYINLMYIEINITVKKDGLEIHVATIRDMGNVNKIINAVRALTK